MTQTEFDWLVKLEQRFVENLLERFRRWGMKTKISPKEWGIIPGLSEKIIP